MLVRVACIRCQLESLWTDEPRCFLATVCRDPRRCQATLLDEAFPSAAGSLPMKPAAEPRPMA
jgi:hypothetical protein